MRPDYAAWLCLLCSLTLPGAAHAQSESDAVSWRSSWTPVHDAEYVYIGGVVTAHLVIELSGLHRSRDAYFAGPLPLDSFVRDQLRADSLATQLELDRASDYVWWAVELYPLYADVLVATLIAHQQPALAWQLFVISSEVLLTVGLLTRVAHITVRRQRPIYRYNDESVEGFGDLARGPTLSFFSGHTALAFAGAGLTCAFHEQLPLYGGGWIEPAACIATLTGAGVVAWMRLISDQHYFSDIVFSAALGLTAGYLVPRWMHLHEGPQGEVSLLPTFSDESVGLAAVGRF